MFIDLDGKISHKEWRKLVKKLRRKHVRSIEAEQEEKNRQVELSIRLLDPEYRKILRLNEELEAEAQKIEEEAALKKKQEWIARDKALHQKWLNDKKLKEIMILEKEKQEALIRKEWKEKQEKELEEKTEDNQKNQLLVSATDALSKNATRLPSPPPGYVRQEDRPKREECPFFIKTGACRFGIHCSRDHIYPEVSKCILIANMYNYLGLENHMSDIYDTDLLLEFTEREVLDHYNNFYADILPEFQKCGVVTHLKVCCNKSAHLRGNVYVEYKEELQAMKAYALFNGRYYAGRQLTCVYVTIEKWKTAICGLFWQKRCPKGSNCNFLHIFKNPDNNFNNVELGADEFSSRNESRYSHYSRYESPSSRRSSSTRTCSPSSSRRHGTHKKEDHYRRSRSRSQDKNTKSSSTRKHKKHLHRRSRSKSREVYQSKRSNETKNKKHTNYRSRSRSSDRYISKKERGKQKKERHKFDKSPSRSRDRLNLSRSTDKRARSICTHSRSRSKSNDR